jgi:phosphoesterase RecJ-like protein
VTTEIPAAPTGSWPAISEDVWARAVATVAGADSVALACHVSPDGDALGSMLAFGLALRQAGRRVVASFGDRRFAVPRLLRFLPGQDLLVAPGDYPEAPEVMLTFDASTMARLGLLAPNATRAAELVVVDHHASNTGFGTVRLVEPSAAATTMLVEEFLRRLGLSPLPGGDGAADGRPDRERSLGRDVATCLYTGLVTDTGSFRHSSTTPGVHAMAARLVATGLRTDEIARELWDRSPFGYLKVLGAALGRVRLEEPGDDGGAGIVWTYVTRADRAAACLPYDEVEGVIDVVRRADEAEVAVVLKEDDDGAWQVSTRSKGAVDVARACAALGGGGHARAAGFTSRLSPEATLDLLRPLLVRG